MNISWGVSSSLVTTNFKGSNGNLESIQKLSEVIRLFNGKSSQSKGTVAISTPFK